MKKRCNTRMIVWVFIVVAISVIMVTAQFLCPRFEQSYKEMGDIYAENYVDGDYVKVKVTEEDKKKIYSIIKYSWIHIDCLAGDECGCDGPGIQITYDDGTSEYWGCSETNHAAYIKYDYLNGWGTVSLSFKSNRILDIINEYTTK